MHRNRVLRLLAGVTAVCLLALALGLVPARPASAYTAQACVNSEAMDFYPPITGIAISSGQLGDFAFTNCERYTAPASIQNVQYNPQQTGIPFLGSCEIVLINDGLSGFLVDGGVGLTYGTSPPFTSVKLLVVDGLTIDQCPIVEAIANGESVGVGLLGNG